ncbi:hypothetical protein [Streptomyces sp. CB03911]|uniref:hypothetical protein n=1 Tax=Streptomyces sp. CB03911 TaxID=1804758 RepID=UPI00093A1FC7|nr:hypothetical protein [Streptomyces sp. CB03911]OKI28878.1 hypothetical protein A6A07_25845 [Streptomyces sp. CB03911]
MTTRPSRPPSRTVAALLLALAAAACAAPPAPGPAAAAPPGARTSAAADLGPSPASLMVCAGSVPTQLSGAFGTDPATPPAGTWAQHLYTCTYAYAEGTLLITVKELADRATAAAHFDGLRGSAGPVTPLTGLGDAAYTQADGSTVVLRDSSVLAADVHRLPERFGRPPRSRSNVSVTVATTVMICWKEHAP